MGNTNHRKTPLARYLPAPLQRGLRGEPQSDLCIHTYHSLSSHTHQQGGIHTQDSGTPGQGHRALASPLALGAAERRPICPAPGPLRAAISEANPVETAACDLCQECLHRQIRVVLCRRGWGGGEWERLVLLAVPCNPGVPGATRPLLCRVRPASCTCQALPRTQGGSLASSGKSSFSQVD